MPAGFPDVPPGIPSELLERRPDIAAAERRAAAANAQIGVAEAAFFPSLTLSATGGFQSSLLSHLISLPSRYWSIGTALAQTIFDAGLRRAQTAQAIATYDENVANYRQTVLAGFQEVEDNLAALRILEQEAVVQDDAVKSARESVTITLNQYRRAGDGAGQRTRGACDPRPAAGCKRRIDQGAGRGLGCCGVVGANLFAHTAGNSDAAE